MRSFVTNSHIRNRSFARHRDMIMWTRQELMQLLAVYGRYVAAGEWRDYGMSHAQDRAIFVVHRRSREVPLYRVEKVPSLRNKQGMYQLLSMDGRILRRGHELPPLLRFFDKRNLSIIG